MRILWQFVTTFFRWTWRLLNFIREFILNIFVILLIVIGVSLYFQYHVITVEPPKGALLINLTGVVVDKPAMNNRFTQWSRELLGYSNNRLHENSLFEIVESIRQAKSDSNITGAVLSLNDFVGADQPSLQYIGKALREFRDSGKPIYAIGDNYNQSQYYLASFANKIYLSPQGSIQLHGFASNTLYYKSLLDKLLVTTNIFRVGTYKSAVEPMIRDNMSPEARAADTRWIDGLWQNYLTEIAANRHLTTEQIFPGGAGIVSGLKAAGGDDAQYALDNKLVDQLASRPVIEEELSKTFGWDKQNNDFNFISIYNYEPESPPEHASQIAIILINGTILNGLQTPGNVGGDTAAAQIRQARLDPQIKGVILRVNSPGGSVSASEVIRAELVALRTSGKPIVVSMGGLAASAGYSITTPSDYIIASPSTLTGSIGVFGVINTFENSLDSIGVHTDGVATSPLAGVTLTKSLPQEFSQMMQLIVENDYKRFIDSVATARKKTPEQIDQIAQGRVWIGHDAKNNGLVDQLGDFDDAVNKVAELAKLKVFQLQWFIDQPSFGDMILNQISVSTHAMLSTMLQAWLPAPLSAAVVAVKDQPGIVSNLNDPQNRYALCLTCDAIY